MLGGNERTDKLTAPNMNSPILVTGASQRVGLALALELAQAGHTVVSASRSLQPQSAHPNIVQFQADLCQAADRQALIDYLQGHYDGLRAIIHNASLWLDDGLANLDTMFRLHVEAPYHLNLALGEMLGKAGSVGKADIIHICDETSSRGSKSHIGYAATKAALQNMVLSFAEKYAPKVHVNGILPGLLILKEGGDEAYRQQTLKKALLEFEPGAGPLIETVKYLLESQYSTGSQVVINGGRHLKNRMT
ncbi:dihydromonapterin reductase [Pseudomonas sp. P1B16]|jgi:dihydromonapterin reductase/dihydrofolate reductase|uniref:Dihydromonapterin reductase n=1 Tax=Pseudomonas capeferrum TaxID=1495066 RepID=A0ABY7R6T3_9PSED|nr:MULTISPECIES: dihydromonapterin reductase [Pseudomonas]KEY85601.1 dienelactone hydrolase [Pseudomonas capeferrum]MCH7297969.1 dihydromonapterin reductase [Pseudomonas capeferrum]MDD2063984.1 dihydromonapterin reductase [Pseudomonas sp. 25571]MDD2130391.1 dihydromonapterin reductase [Pseudomonas sp. 17391]MUT52501.1 dihydromonapterin reductase [Pseudomonas sp. TDA1]